LLPCLSCVLLESSVDMASRNSRWDSVDPPAIKSTKIPLANGMTGLKRGYSFLAIVFHWPRHLTLKTTCLSSRLRSSVYHGHLMRRLEYTLMSYCWRMPSWHWVCLTQEVLQLRRSCSQQLTRAIIAQIFETLLSDAFVIFLLIRESCRLARLLLHRNVVIDPS
jgi:hypothetical protein